MASSKSNELFFLADQQDQFLANFYSEDIHYKFSTYKTAEHFYQASKCEKESDINKIYNAKTAREAKILGKFIEPRANWERMKADVMDKILRIKFLSNEKMKKLLHDTGDATLIQLNYWHDTYWGCCICTQHARTGKNMLGVLLMKIRAEIDK